MNQDEKYMKAAIRQAKKAYALDEVPIGCVIVQNDKIIARGYNRRNTEGNTLAHAELTAIRKASKKTGRLAVRGLHDVCDVRAMSDVCRCDRSEPDEKSGDRKHESQSRMCRIGVKSASDAAV